MDNGKYCFNLEYCSPENRAAVMRFMNDFTEDGKPPFSPATVKSVDFHCNRVIGGSSVRDLTYVYYEHYDTVLVKMGARFAVMHFADFDKCLAALTKRKADLSAEEKALREKIASTYFL